MTRRLAASVYRWFLRIVPSDFRSAYGSDMEDAFVESLAIREQKGGALGMPWALGRALWDLLALAYRLHRVRPPSRSRGGQSSRLGTAVSGVSSDFRFALRRLCRTPSLTLASVLTLALGIASTVLMLTVVDAVLIRPLPYREADRLVALFLNEENHDAPRAPTSPVNFLAWRAESKSLTLMTAAHPWAPSLTGWDRPDELHGLKVTPTLFPLLSIPPLLGRGLEPDDDPAAIVLGYDLWKRRFGADQNIVGRSLTLDGEAHVVVGVMPEEFRFPPFWSTEAEFWAPLLFTPEAAGRHSRYLRVFARLVDGVSFDDARSEMETIGARLVVEHPIRNAATSITIEPLLEPVVAGARPVIILLLAAVVLLTFIACANIANLQMVRSSARAHELALEAALGAGRGRRLRQQLAESLLFSLGSGVLGGLAASWGVLLLNRLAPKQLPRLQEIGLDGTMVFSAFAISMVVALGLSVLTTPRALQLGGRGVGAALRESGARSTAFDGKRIRDALVVAQVTTSVVLLVAAGLVVRSFLELRSVDPGFRQSHLLTASLLLAGSSHTEPQRQSLLFGQVRQAVGEVAGVDDVALINHLPIGGDSWGLGFRLEGHAVEDEADRQRASQRTVTPGYLQTMGVPLIAGRDFRESDDALAAPVVMVNRTLATRYATIETILGRRVDLGEDDFRVVVGVVGDTKQWDLTQEVEPEIYFPYAQNPSASFLTTTLIVASGRPPEELQATVEQAVWSVAGEIPVANVRTMERILSDHVASRRLTSLLFATFAGLALALAAVGLYGVLSYSVSQQMFELGIRAALGASRDDIHGLVFGRGARLVGLGLVAGLLVSLAGGRFLSGLLFGISSTDPWTFLVVPFFMAAVAFVAIFLPARRAARLDPLAVLRNE